MNKAQIILEAVDYVTDNGSYYSFSCNCISFAVDRAGIHDRMVAIKLRTEYAVFLITKYLKDEYMQFCEEFGDISYAHSVEHSYISATFFDATYGTDSAEKRREALLAFAEYLMGNEP